MDIDKLLLDLMNKYKINTNLMKKKKIISCINNLIDNLPNDKTIAIRGGGEHTEKLLSCIKNKKNLKKIKFIIDNNANNITKYKLINSSEIKFYKIDIIIISSFAYKEEMELEIFNLDCNCKIIDIYDYLLYHSLKLNEPFYIFCKDKRSYSCYESIFLNKKKYISESNIGMKELYLERLIFDYLDIKDFLNANKYINEYINNNYSNSKIYKQFYDELLKLLHNIKCEMKMRKHKDIILTWIDSLRYDEVFKMQYLNSLSKKSMFFENAFTMSPWTSQTAQTIFKNKKPIDDHLFDENINTDNSPVLKLIDDNYKFKYIGNYEWFDEKYIIKVPYRQTCTESFWMMLSQLLNSDEKCFIFIHSVAETHYPFYSGNLEKISFYVPETKNWPPETGNYNDIKKMVEQIDDSRNYFDAQLEWYNDFMEYNHTQIYLSDHGKEYDESYSLPIFVDPKIHVVLFIVDNSISPQKCNQMFSYLNFYYLLKYIINPTKKNYRNIFSEFVEIQIIDFYNKEVIELKIDEIINGHISERLGKGIAIRGVRSDYDKYIKYADNELKYYLLPNEKDNLIYDNKYSERIQELDILTKKYFIDIYKYEKFKYTRELYKALNKYNRSLKQNTL